MVNKGLARDLTNSAALQVGLTDNAPIYIMGGVVMPLGEGGMVTDAARNSSLTLVVRGPLLVPGACVTCHCAPAVERLGMLICELPGAVPY